MIAGALVLVLVASLVVLAWAAAARAELAEELERERGRVAALRDTVLRLRRRVLDLPSRPAVPDELYMPPDAPGLELVRGEGRVAPVQSGGRPSVEVAREHGSAGALRIATLRTCDYCGGTGCPSCRGAA